MECEIEDRNRAEPKAEQKMFERVEWNAQLASNSHLRQILHYIFVAITNMAFAHLTYFSIVCFLAFSVIKKNICKM